MLWFHRVTAGNTRSSSSTPALRLPATSIARRHRPCTASQMGAVLTGRRGRCRSSWTGSAIVTSAERNQSCGVVVASRLGGWRSWVWTGAAPGGRGVVVDGGGFVTGVFGVDLAGALRQRILEVDAYARAPAVPVVGPPGCVFRDTGRSAAGAAEEVHTRHVEADAHPTRQPSHHPDRTMTVGSPRGISPRGSHGTERDSLPSFRSSHRSPANVRTHGQCVNSPGSRSRIPRHHLVNRL